MTKALIRRTRGVAALAMLAMLAMLAKTGPVQADPARGTRALGSAGLLDPARTEKDLPDVLRDNHAFCTQPTRPLSLRARELCSVADRIPNCGGFVSACAEEQRPVVPDKPPEARSSFVQALARAMGHLATALIWILIAVVAVAILFPLLRMLVRSRKDKALAETVDAPKQADGTLAQPAGELLAEDDAELLLRRAEGHAQQGQLTAALFAYLNASLRALDKRGAIRIARHRTNGEYVRACSEPTTKEPLQVIVREVDRVQFGGVAPTADMIARAAERATAIVRSGAALATIALIALTVMGCGFHFPSHGGRGTDPAGNEILTELLHRQGVTVAPLGSSLASLPMPENVARPQTYAILVDTDRTLLESGTEDHLLRWVRAGGFLVLAGSPAHWPSDLGAVSDKATSPDIEIVSLRVTDDEDDEDDEAEPLSSKDDTRIDHARLVKAAAVRFKEHPPFEIAKTGDGKLYAGYRPLEKGTVLTIASSDLLMNAQLAQPANAAAIVAILRLLDRAELRVARSEDGISPPTNPITALERAGLGLAFYHSLAATLVLFVAVGVRLARSRPNKPDTRRAFTEHIEATGAFYHRRRAASHALAAYARYAEERIRQRLPRGAQDVAGWLGQRSGVSTQECADVWQRATTAHALAVPRGDELLVLKRLSAIVSAALRMD